MSIKYILIFLVKRFLYKREDQTHKYAHCCNSEMMILYVFEVIITATKYILKLQHDYVVMTTDSFTSKRWLETDLGRSG